MPMGRHVFNFQTTPAFGQKKCAFQLPCLENKTKKGLRIYELDLNFKMKLKLYYLLYIIEFKIQHRPLVGFFTYRCIIVTGQILLCCRFRKKNQDKLKDIFFKNSNHD